MRYTKFNQRKIRFDRRRDVKRKPYSHTQGCGDSRFACSRVIAAGQDQSPKSVETGANRDKSATARRFWIESFCIALLTSVGGLWLVLWLLSSNMS